MGIYSYNLQEQAFIESLILRQFPPFSTPAPYSHEQEPGWDKRCFESGYCRPCSHWGKSTCSDAWADDDFHHTSDCSVFTEYRHILFRRFEPFTEAP